MSKPNRWRRIAFLLQRDGWECWICHKPFTSKNPPTFDHHVPRFWGGTDGLYNLRLAHGRCNRHRSHDEGRRHRRRNRCHLREWA